MWAASDANCMGALNGRLLSCPAVCVCVLAASNQHFFGITANRPEPATHTPFGRLSTWCYGVCGWPGAAWGFQTCRRARKGPALKYGDRAFGWLKHIPCSAGNENSNEPFKPSNWCFPSREPKPGFIPTHSPHQRENTEAPLRS